MAVDSVFATRHAQGDGAVYINGRFLTQNITGVQRFAREMVMALDTELGGADGTPLPFTLLAPAGTPPPCGLSRIGFRAIGSRRGHLWEQWDLWRASRRGFLINLANGGPVLHRRQITFIHDAAVYRTGENFSPLYRTLHRGLGRLLARRSRLGTVSAFSRNELGEVLGLPPEDILVIPDGHDHILAISPEDGVLDRLRLRQRSYFLFVGSPTANKNLARAVAAFLLLERPDTAFVIVGATRERVFRAGLSDVPSSVVLPGRLNDGEICALYRHATALVFPSLYEGFGIPPLEAMALGCPVAASRIPPVQEVCADAALYFDPLDTEDMATRMAQLLADGDLRNDLISKGAMRLPRFAWRQSAQALARYVAAQLPAPRSSR
jgi:glycosyltransferase involved in cell wall biosynthesis